MMPRQFQDQGGVHPAHCSSVGCLLRCDMCLRSFNRVSLKVDCTQLWLEPVAAQVLAIVSLPAPIQTIFEICRAFCGFSLIATAMHVNASVIARPRLQCFTVQVHAFVKGLEQQPGFAVQY